jgi:hypothetical protein
MNKQQAIAKLNEEFQNRLKSDLFPQELLPESFNHWKNMSFQYESIYSLQKSYNLSFQEYKVLCMKQNKFTLYEVAIISNSIEMRTPNELDKWLEENYYSVQQEIYNINEQWKKIVDPMKQEIERKIAIMGGSQMPMTQRGLNIINGGKKK